MAPKPISRLKDFFVKSRHLLTERILRAFWLLKNDAEFRHTVIFIDLIIYATGVFCMLLWLFLLMFDLIFAWLPLLGLQGLIIGSIVIITVSWFDLS
jgi:hypothetical protein